ncbi:MAG TPA: DUF2141 domain-containing protein [Bacteroidales bacterium]|nr:DUF2141 domain-containing protein [Bacteroidales bacterium]
MRTFLSIIALFIYFPVHAGPAGDSLRVVVKGLRNHEGLMNITLFDSATGFPGDIDRAVQWDSKAIEGDSVMFTFYGLSPGEYAFAVLHDENGDGKMNKVFPGLPKEGFAFSTNYRPVIRAPSFKDVSFPVGGKNVVLHVELIYYFR